MTDTREARLTNWQLADFFMGCVVLVWTAEALVRFGIGFEITTVVYAYFGLRFIMTLRKFVPVIMQTWPVLLYPGFCFLSVYWSVSPVHSAVSAVQIGFTILFSLFLGLQFSLRQLAFMIFLALGATMIASLTNFGGQWGNAYSWEGGYLGIYTNKNALGQRGTLLLLTCVYLLVSGRGKIAALLVALVTIYLLSISKSATSVLISGVCCAGLIMSLLTQKSRGVAPWIMLATVTGMALVIAFITGLGISPFDEVLEAFGKNTTLTGRTVLWEHGLHKIAETPVLGKGAMAYWVAPEFAQEVGVLRDIYGTTVSAFHNFVIEILVMLGPLGLIAMGALLFSSFRAIWTMQNSPEKQWALWVFATLIILSLLGSSLFRQHEIILVLLVALGVSPRREMLLSPAGSVSQTR